MTTPPGANQEGDDEPVDHEPVDHEQELINAEFESMVSGLSLDESSPRTYLDELDEIEREEADSLNSERALYSQAQASRIPLHLKASFLLAAMKRWWRGGNRDDGEDGARV